MTYFHRFSLLLAVVPLAIATGCAPSSATTRPAAAPHDAQVLAAHGYSMPRLQLVAQIQAVLGELGSKVQSADPEVGVFVAERRTMMQPGFRLTIVLRPAGDRIRVDVTSTCDVPQLIGNDLNKQNVWAFYDGLDKRAGEPS